jgi:antitoxin component YwqK of YwqJK toxin-antitoxin module
MKKSFVFGLFTLLLIVTTACSKSYDWNDVVYSNGKFCTKKDMVPVTGTVYQDKGHKEKYKIGDFENGKRVGIHSWHDGNQLTSEGEFANGLRVGIHKSWYNNGQLKEQGKYSNDLRVGLHREWHWNGELMKQGKYQKDKLIGIHKEWNEYGVLRNEDYWIDNNLAYKKHWKSDGKLEYVIHYNTNGTKIKEFYDDKNEIHRKEVYLNDVLKRTFYFDKGTLCFQSIHENGSQYETKSIFYNEGRRVKEQDWNPVFLW